MKLKLYLTALTLAAVLIFEVHGLDYNDLKVMNVSCPEKDSCATINNQEFYQRNCQCDSQCPVYDDCCIDAPEVSSRSRHNSKRFTCMAYGTSWSHIGAYATSKCQRNWQGPANVKRKCEVLNDLSDLFMAIPVTNAQRNITFRNRYCSECNGEVDSDIKSWMIAIDCSPFKDTDFTLEELSYKSRENKWGINRENVFHECSVKFMPPQYLYYTVRDCVVSVISTCPTTKRGGNVKQMCQSYMAITYRHTQAYRNPHCALCNGIKLNEMRCSIGGGASDAQSFAMILDVNPSDGDTVGVSKKPCPSGQKYDGVFKRCRGPSTCVIPGTEMVNGECVVKN